MPKSAEPNPDNNYRYQHVSLLVSSYRHWTGKHLVPVEIPESETGIYLFNAPFAIVSHNTDSDPVFNYANQTALDLFEMNWDRFTQLPSRKSAEPVNRLEREKLMSRVTQDGYIDDYSGTRISASGKRFIIEQATVWNIVDHELTYKGQAALFTSWEFV